MAVWAAGILGFLTALAFFVIWAIVFGGLQIVAILGGLLSLFVFLSLVVLSLVWLERKLLGRIQMRMGPMRVGFHGLLQPVADATKLIAKEDIMPAWADRWVFWIAPVAFFLPAFMIWVTIPFSSGLMLRNLELGLLYIIAFSVLAIVGLLMAGWGSANKYGILGGIRAAAQLISYEIPIIVVALTVAMMGGTLNLVEIVEGQGRIPNVAIMPLSFLLFLLAGLAEVGRTPFDIFHAESEVVGGPYVEYSGAHWAVFYLAEYINTFLIATLVTLLFLGGWVGPLLPPVLWLLIKVYAVIAVMFWFRGTFPRFRIDQLMDFGWKVLVPISFANLVLTATALFYHWPSWILALASSAALIAFVLLLYRRMTAPGRRPTLKLIPAAELRRA
ncbi:MAG: NADH-quinone oxidoreductase subunit NuoH [Chloroflexi bacterium]|nr:NADH-quinone oxidoreductase subunit NuoH [Chloroflexota bacterium]